MSGCCWPARSGSLRLAAADIAVASRGAATSIHLASAADLEQVTGGYFAADKPRSSAARSYREAAAARLWQVSADLTGLATAA
jgi:retinol dehydrogenase 14